MSSLLIFSETIQPILPVVKKEKDNPSTAFVSTEATKLFRFSLRDPPSKQSTLNQYRYCLSKPHCLKRANGVGKASNFAKGFFKADSLAYLIYRYFKFSIFISIFRP